MKQTLEGSQNESRIPGWGFLGSLRPYIRHCGDSRRPAWVIETRRLLDYLIVYIDKGRGIFNIGDNVYDAHPRDVFWIPPDTPHRMEGYSPGMVCVYAHFDLIYREEISHWDFSIPGGTLDLEELKSLMHPPVNIPEINNLCGQIRFSDSVIIGGMLREIVAAAWRARPYSGLVMSGIMLNIIANLLRCSQQQQQSDARQLAALEEAAQYFREHLQEDISIDSVGRSFGYSSAHFRLLFGRYFGCPPREYITNCRIRRAQELMFSSQYNLSEIARKCGFSSLQSFSRAFKTHEGVSPGSYRRCGKDCNTRVEGRKANYSY